ncbi:MAG: hypothetical protein HFH68_00140 [Lachnospiraceae bacterium]|nr:hypothetical protein [Lachnospiraceae bacterium]
MKLLSRHEKTIVVLFIIATFLLIVSLLPGGYEEATNILQGLATGVISGIVLLFINGIKSKEYRQLTEIIV